MVVHSQPEVFTELLDAIFNYLWLQGDFASLKTCALVCQFWLPIAQALIFHSVTFNQPTWAKFINATNSFLETVEQNPHLITYVRDFCFNWTLWSIHPLLDRVTFPSVKSFTLKRISMVDPNRVASTRPLLKLPSLTKILLIEDNFRDLRQFSTFFDQEHSVNIITVQLHRVCILRHRNLTEIQRARIRLHNLAFPNFQLSDEDTPPPSPSISSAPRIRPKLQTLEIVRGHASLLASWFIKPGSPFDLTALKTLKYEEDLENPDVTNLVNLLGTCAMSLENLDIYSHSENLKTNDLDIGTNALPNLQHLTISGISPYSIANVISWLSQLTRDSRLHTLVLKFSFGKLKLAANEQPLQTWQDLDNIVDNLPVFKLERIEVKIPQRNQKRSVQEISKAYLPKVMERSICVLTIL